MMGDTREQRATDAKLRLAEAHAVQPIAGYEARQGRLTTARKRAGYRPMPRDFAETFIRVGWDSIEAECRANKRTVKRWLREYGEEQLQQARRARLEEQYGAQGKRVPGIKPGRTLTAVNSAPQEA